MAEGAVTGGIIGGLAGLLTGAGVFPALAGFLIGGPIAVALGLTGMAAATATGAITGAVAGGLIGALMGLGFSREEAEYYHSTIESGGLLLVVPVNETNEAEASGILSANNAQQIKRITMSKYHLSTDDRIARTDLVRDSMHDESTIGHSTAPRTAAHTRAESRAGS
jgi:hypothetical protein